jgi:hypothetical protein
VRRSGSGAGLDAGYGSNTEAGEEGWLALRLETTEEGSKTVRDVLTVDGLSVENGDSLVEEVHHLRLTVFDDSDGEGFEEESAGEEDALEDARWGDAEVTFRSEEVACLVEDGLGG